MKFETLTLLVLSIGMFAQQLPVFTQHFCTKSYTNPALVGSSEKINAFIATKQTWLATPVKHATHIISVETPASQQRIGLGLITIQDQFPLQKRLMIKGSASYKINMLNGYMRMGLSAGYTHSSLDTKDLNIKDLDDAYLEKIGPLGYFSANFGIAYQRATYMVGIAARNLNKPKLSYNPKYTFSNPSKINYTLYVEKKIILNQGLTLHNYVTGAYSDSYDFYASCVSYFSYKEDLSLGAGYRTLQSICVVAAVRLSKLAKNLDNFSICYAYESGLGALNTITKNTHEIGIKIEFEKLTPLKSIKNKPKEISPLDF